MLPSLLTLARRFLVWPASAVLQRGFGLLFVAVLAVLRARAVRLRRCAGRVGAGMRPSNATVPRPHAATAAPVPVAMFRHCAELGTRTSGPATRRTARQPYRGESVVFGVGQRGWRRGVAASSQVRQVRPIRRRALSLLPGAARGRGGAPVGRAWRPGTRAGVAASRASRSRMESTGGPEGPMAPRGEGDFFP